MAIPSGFKTFTHLTFSSTARAPVFTHVKSTLEGLSVIRSSKAQQRMIRQFDSLQDLHSSVWFLFLSTTIAFCQVLDLLVMFLVAVVLGYFLIYPTGELSIDLLTGS